MTTQPLNSSLGLINVATKPTEKMDLSLPQLNYLCIYHLGYGKREENKIEQILYYGNNKDKVDTLPLENELENVESPLPFMFSFNQSDDTVLRQVGLAQAMINFSKTFTPNEIIDNVHSKKTRLVILQPEKELYFLMNINLGIRIRKSEKDKKSNVVDYLDKDLSDISLKTILNRAYQRFRLGYGTINNLIENEGLDKTKYILKTYYDGYLNNINLTKLNVAYNINGIPILSNNKTTFLKIQNFIKSLNNQFPMIEATSLFHNQQLVWSGSQLPLEVSRFLIELISKDKKKDKEVEDKTKRSSIFSVITPYLFSNTSTPPSPTEISKFKVKVFDMWNPKSPFNGKLINPINFIKTFFIGEKNVPIYCLIFNIWDMGYLSLFFSDLNSLDDDIVNNIEIYIKNNIMEMNLESAIINDQLNNEDMKLSINKNYKYCHFNSMNLALNINLNNIPNSLNNLLLELQQQVIKNQNNNNNFEMLLRTIDSIELPSCWVGVKFNSDYSIYFIIDKNLNLADVEDHVSKLSNLYFNNLFLED